MSDKKKYKYPFIPREYYPAVMFACKLIREGEGFNTAVSIASNYYEVDEEEVIKRIRARQAAGQKGKTRKYRYYALAFVVGQIGEAVCDPLWEIREPKDLFNELKYEVKRATGPGNAAIQLDNKYSVERTRYSDSYYAADSYVRVLYCKEVGKDDGFPVITHELANQIWQNFNRRGDLDRESGLYEYEY